MNDPQRIDPAQLPWRLNNDDREIVDAKGRIVARLYNQARTYGQYRVNAALIVMAVNEWYRNQEQRR